MATDTQYVLASDNEEYLIINKSDPNRLTTAQAYFDRLTISKQMEGVVIKPQMHKKKIAPYIKVRNPNYLTIVYGPDYQVGKRYQTLLKKKSVTKKLQRSITEFELGLEMLVQSYASINIDNVQLQQIVANLLFECEKEAELDPRL